MTPTSPPTAASSRWRVPMTARPTNESHRTSTPLELLFDLTFVVAVAQAAVATAHKLEEDRPGPALGSFLLVFFAIWWAWMNFTWFASAYDTDDVPYRLLTMVQMAGVLIVAAGVPQAFEGRFTAVVIGYFVMRIAMVAQWLRASRSDPEHRTATRRYAGLIAVLQVLWLFRLLLEDRPAAAALSFILLALAEISVPFVAERSSMTTWHPHHIAERYGLFTIIVLGECVVSATVAIQASIDEAGWSADVVIAFIASLMIIFELWWLYFLKPSGEGLATHRRWSFYWGYGHFFVHGALGALAAGLEVVAAALLHHLEISDRGVALSVAIPVALFMVLIWGLNAPLHAASVSAGGPIIAAAVAVLAIAGLLPAAGVSLPWTILLIAVPPIPLIGYAVARGPAGGLV